MLFCHNYNTLSRSNASYWLIFKLRDVSYPSLAGRRGDCKTSSPFKWPVRRFELKADGR